MEVPDRVMYAVVLLLPVDKHVYTHPYNIGLNPAIIRWAPAAKWGYAEHLPRVNVGPKGRGLTAPTVKIFLALAVVVQHIVPIIIADVIWPGAFINQGLVGTAAV
jgi:hypothetical protein